MSADTKIVRIAIVGGGCAGITTAWELAKNNLRANAREFYDITVYEKSSMLGGKGASYRDEDGRIHEHGLHIWLGFYENAFRVIREAYAEAARLGMGPAADDDDKCLPFGSFEAAFRPESQVGVANQAGDGHWEAWTGFLPPMKGLPGDPLDDDTNPYTLAGYLKRCIGLSLALMHSVIEEADSHPAGAPRPDDRSASDEARDLQFASDNGTSPDALVGSMARWIENGFLASVTGLLQGVMLFEKWLKEFTALPQYDFTVLKYLEALATQLRRRLARYVKARPKMRRKTEIIDLIVTIVVGLYRDRVLFDETRGLDAIDDIDCKAWLTKHGALKSSVESPFVTGLYDLAFCYEDGDRKRPALAAGQGIRGALRMFFTYRGSIFWRLGAGMGETVFSPLYRVLASKPRYVDGKPAENPHPVKFSFMHELDELVVEDAAQGLLVSELTFKILGRAEPPLDRFGCWRHTAPGDSSGTLRLRRDGDIETTRFDGVVFALGLDDFRTVARGVLGARSDAWKNMFDNLKTVATQAAQVWLEKEMPALGWTRGPVLISGYEEPLETWADMTHTIPSEQAWARRYGKKPKVPGSAAYFCGVLSEEHIPKPAKGKRSKAQIDEQAVDDKLRAMVEDNLRKALTGGMRPFWPRAYGKDGETTALDDLVGDFDNQYWRANWRGSDRYTLALPGTARFRISPLERMVSNMTIAGDWTSCGFNEGCVESAVMSGLLAAHALSGMPALEDIIGFDHP